MSAWLTSETTYYLGGVLFGVVGLFLLITGWRGRAITKPACRKCRYDMSASPSLSCPECGRKHKHAGELWRQRMRKRRFVCGLLLVSVACYAHASPQVKWRQWTLKEPWHQSIVPTTAWIVLMPVLSDKDWACLTRRLGTNIEENSRPGNYRWYEPFNPYASSALPHWQLWLLARSSHTVLHHTTPSEQRKRDSLYWIIVASDRVDAAIDMLAEALSDNDSMVYNAAFNTLRHGTRRARAAAAIPNLIAQFNHADRDFARSCAWLTLQLASELDPESPLFKTYLDARPAIAAVVEEERYVLLNTWIDNEARDFLLKDPAYRRPILFRALLGFQDGSAWWRAGNDLVKGDWSNAADMVPMVLDHLLNEPRQEMAFEHLRWTLQRIGRIREEDKAAVRRIIASTDRAGRKIVMDAIDEIDETATEVLMFFAEDPNEDIAAAARARLIGDGELPDDER